MARRSIGWVLMALAACSNVGEQGVSTVELGDVSEFRSWVQPALRDTCTSIDCHGRLDRPLRLYSLWGLRESAALRGEVESDAEIESNVLAIVGIDPGAAAADHLALKKPLAVSAGGYAHEGGDVWVNTDTDGYRCLLAWLESDLAGNADAEAACLRVATNP